MIEDGLWIAGTAITPGQSEGDPSLVTGLLVTGGIPVVVVGPVSVTQGTVPWVVSGTVSATQGTSPWVVSGTVSATQGTSPWVVSGTITANQGTSPWVVSGTVAISGAVAVTQSTSPWNVGELGVIDPNNSSTTPLAANGVFTGGWTDILNYAGIFVTIDTDKDSATSGVQIQFSTDGITVLISHPTTFIVANLDEVHAAWDREARFFRVVYTNGPVAQGTFILSTILSPLTAKYGRHFLSETAQQSSSSITTQSQIIGRTTAAGGAFVPVKVNPSGALTVDATQATSPWVVSGTVVVSSITGIVTVKQDPLTAPFAVGAGVPLGASGSVGVKTDPSDAEQLVSFNGGASGPLEVALLVHDDAAGGFLFIGKGQKLMTNSVPVAIASDQSTLPTAQLPATLVQTSAGAPNTAVTLTLPAVAGQFHYITHIHARRVATAALAGGALLQITTTNLGGRQWRTGNQASITVSTYDGAVAIDAEYVHPLKSAVVGTATTFVFPAPGAAVSWDVTVDYYTAP